MAWMKSKNYKAMTNYFAEKLDNNNSDLAIIKEVLAMESFNENGGEYMSNIKNEIEIKGLSDDGISCFDTFADHWNKTIQYRFEHKTGDLYFEDFLFAMAK